MAIRNNIFYNCSDETTSLVLQYNDIFFVPGTVASYNNGCWIDSQVNSVLVPVADVTFDNYENCESCINITQVGYLIENCDSLEQAIVTFQIDNEPQIGTFILYANACWEVLSQTDANSNTSPQLNSYVSCEICSSFIDQEEEAYQRALFVNCCNPSDTQVFNIIASNFGGVLGSTVVYNNTCYSYDSLVLSGTIVGTFPFPQFSNCNFCLESNPCVTPTPTPTPTYTATPTPTLTATPTTTPTLSVTPTPTQTFSTTTTTTTIRPVSRNECLPITLFPMGVECFTVDPTAPTLSNGSMTISITGGTPPYTILWSTGAQNVVTLNNLGTGSYTAFVIDYYGDFSAQTTCSVVAPSPVPTNTPTPTMTPTPSQQVFDELCLTLNVDGQIQQFEFNYYTIINGKPSWTASTTDTLITTSGVPLFLTWTLPGLSSEPTLGPEYRITGWNGSLWYLSSTTSSTPPVSGWGVIGSSPNVSVISLVNGPCPLYSDLQISTFTNSTSCPQTADGSVCITVLGGSGFYEYSIDGVNYGTSNCFYNLLSGSYSVYVIDLIDPSLAVAQNVVISSVGTTSTLTLGYTQVQSTDTTINVFTNQNFSRFLLNTSVIPMGVTVNLSFNLSSLLQVFEPGNGSAPSSLISILKNGNVVSPTITPGSSSITNRPGCFPYKINSTQVNAVATTTVTTNDILLIQILNLVTVTDPQTDGCITRIQNNMNVNTSFTYSGIQDCTQLIGGNLSVGTTVFRELGS
jgi:hypothetical protein